MATAALDRSSVRSTEAYQVRPSIATAMTPARSPNMNSGCPPDHQAVEGFAAPSRSAGARRNHLERAVGHGHHVAARKRAGLHGLLDQAQRFGRDVVAFVLGDGKRVCQLAGRKPQHALRVTLDIVADRHQRQDADRRDDDEENQDQHGDRPPEHRFGGKKTTIGRRCDDARIPCDLVPARIAAPGKSRAFGRAPRVRSGHAVPPTLKLTIRRRRTPESSIRNQR